MEPASNAATPPAEPAHSADALFDAVYARLKAMAARQLGARERGTLLRDTLVRRVGRRRHGALGAGAHRWPPHP